MLLESRRGLSADLQSAALSPITRLRAVDSRLKAAGPIYPFVVAVVSCLIWILVTQLVRMIGWGGFYGVPVALGAVVVAAWVGGAWAGLITAGFSAVLLYEFLPAARMLSVEEESLWHLAVFCLVAVIMSSFQSALRDRRRRELSSIEERDQFLDIVSHELRTPTTIISGSASLLARLWDEISDHDRKELLSDMQEESARLSRMIEDLLLLARIEEQASPANEPLALQPTLLRSVHAFERLYPGRAIDLDMPQDRLVLLGRDSYVEAVLSNVLSNAHRFSPLDASIEVRAQCDGDGALSVVVRDHGPGVSEELLSEIYEPYHRTLPVSGGTRGLGLGLVLCKRAMEQMGGQISASGLADGGLAVCLKFRLADE